LLDNFSYTVGLSTGFSRLVPFLKYSRSLSLDTLASRTPYFSYTVAKTIINCFHCLHPL